MHSPGQLDRGLVRPCRDSPGAGDQSPPVENSQWVPGQSNPRSPPTTCPDSGPSWTLWTVDSGQWTVDSGQWTVGHPDTWTVVQRIEDHLGPLENDTVGSGQSWQRTVDSEQWTVDRDQWTVDNGLLLRRPQGSGHLGTTWIPQGNGHHQQRTDWAAGQWTVDSRLQSGCSGQWTVGSGQRAVDILTFRAVDRGHRTVDSGQWTVPAVDSGSVDQSYSVDSWTVDMWTVCSVDSGQRLSLSVEIG